MLNDERLGPCLEEAMRTVFEEGADEGQAAVEVGDIEIEQLGDDGLGDAGVGLQGTTEIMTPAATLLVSFAVESVRVDRAVVAVGTVAVGTEEPTVNRAALLEVLVDGVSDQST